jgi:hypothetical protein
MRLPRVVLWAVALAALAFGAQPGRAAWNNVFQVCCASCGGQSSSSFAAPDACCNPCPQQCTTRYVQRSYYQPVTCYVNKTYYEQVTTYHRSYYYEPVTSYRYSCYFDPCTCQYQQVACPVTTYCRKERCCPVTSYLQRCCLVPVTTYKECTYYEPVQQCCPAPQPCCPAPQPCCPTGNGNPAVPAVPGNPQPGVNEQPGLPPAGVHENPGGNGYGASKKSFGTQEPPLATPNRQLPPAPANNPPQVHLDRIVYNTNPGVEGTVVRSDTKPAGGAKVLFVSADRQGAQQTVTSDDQGQFRATLASGSWLVYVHGADGKPVYHSKVEVKGDETVQVRLTSR